MKTVTKNDLQKEASALPKEILQLGKRVTVIEGALEKHLIESGEIRTDLLWIKRGIMAAVGAAFTSTGALVLCIIAYLLNRIR